MVDSACEDQKPTLLFTNNESRSQAMSQSHSGVYTKDGFNQYVVHGMSHHQLLEVHSDQHWEREKLFCFAERGTVQKKMPLDGAT